MSSSYRYAYITAVDLSIDNGPGINEREFVKELLASYGERIICIIPSPSRPENYSDSRISYVVNHRGRNPFYYLLYLFSLFFKVFKLHRHARLDALVFRLDLFAIEPIILSSLLRIPFFLKTLAGYTGFSNLASKRQRLISLVSLPLYRIATRRAIAADTVSAPYILWQKFIYRLDTDKVHIIRNGANLEMFSPSNKRKLQDEFNLDRFSYVIGYVGALSALRNIDTLIYALAKVNQEKPVALVLVGEGQGRSEIEALVEESGLSANVFFTGAIPYAAVPSYMNLFDAAVDLTCVPMKIDQTILNASYSQKIPQYLGCGLPVIAWSVEDNNFLDAEGIGKLVTIGDTVGLTVAIESLAGLSDVERKDMSSRARLYAEQEFSLNRLTQKRFLLWDESMRKFLKKGEAV
ncbi:Glycosyltransferase involved in cell wall bisynthesis [Desulfuromusa kysingii]|uniref:Glycosyltransferase involved in cell wall bisynthesis n=1 Tax=Desulfuromusa kysingii TaxID=37625 RepID=A0A1H3YHP9_9BACT|nr:glycosyltransferase [Desulfuromusa kysingii]SEA11120.1 Glycosyltransferase involved in cell wall bisynthesis [Desulfuromusa kysingii]